MFEPKNNQPDWENDPWDAEVYRTGTTKPPKKRSGLLAVLLVVVILLGGIVTILGLVNIRLFQKISISSSDDTLPIVLSGPAEDDPLADDSVGSEDAQHVPETQAITLQPSATSGDTVLQEGALSLQDIYEKVIDSVVSITCTYQNSTSTGTGVILTADGYIVTNCHVVEDAPAIHVLLTDGRHLEAELVGMDAISDLAVLYVDAEDLIPAELGDSSVLRVGDSVVAIGDPLGMELRGTMTDGIISAINRDINVDGRTMNLLQTNAALNSGNSGGPLINCYGQVIGINTMKMGDSMSTAGVEGLGFAIPSTTVEEIANQLIGQGYVSGRPSLGITGESVSDFYYFYYHLPQGLLITEVESGSPAAQAGISAGDILISMDGVRITDAETFRNLLYGYDPGDTVETVIYRSGSQYRVSLTVGEANS